MQVDAELNGALGFLLSITLQAHEHVVELVCSCLAGEFRGACSTETLKGTFRQDVRALVKLSEGDTPTASFSSAFESFNVHFERQALGSLSVIVYLRDSDATLTCSGETDDGRLKGFLRDLREFCVVSKIDL